MQIPALWTDLNYQQRSEARAYVFAVFWTAESALPKYQTAVCKDSKVECGWCRCPIGVNHNFLRDSVEIGAPMCFDCAEEEFFIPRNNECPPDERTPVRPALLDRYREVKFQ